MKGISETLLSLGVTYDTLKEVDFFDYHLWYRGAEYSIRFETYGKDKVCLSLRHYGEDLWPNRHVYGDLNSLIGILSQLENKIFYDKKIAFWRKPQALWKAFEEAVEPIQ